MVFRRSQVLTDREDVHLASRQVVEDLQQFVGAFAQTDHHSGLGRDRGIHFLGPFQQAQCALVAGARAGHTIQARHGLGVVVQDVRPRIHHDLQRLFEPLKVGDEHFYAAVGHALANFGDGVGEDRRATDVVVVAVDAGDDGELQAELFDRFGNPPRLLKIDGFGRPLGTAQNPQRRVHRLPSSMKVAV